VVVVVARLGLHDGMAERARGVQDERGWGSVGHAIGKQWAVCWAGRGAVVCGGGGVAVVGVEKAEGVLCGVLCLGAQGAGGSVVCTAGDDGMGKPEAISGGWPASAHEGTLTLRA
jgi:hypothetical protein